MDVHKKERSTRQHLRIDVGRNSPDLLLANPMACGDISPAGMVSPPQPPIARNSERGSFKKSRPKSPSLLRFFVRGGSRKVSSADEEEYGSSSSDHEDPFSVRSLQLACLFAACTVSYDLILVRDSLGAVHSPVCWSGGNTALTMSPGPVC